MINQTNSMMKDNIYSIFCTLSHKSNLKPNLQEKKGYWRQNCMRKVNT